MKDSTVLPFLLGLVFGITAMLFGNGEESDAPHQDAASITEESQEISVLVVTSETIPAFQSISKEMVTVRSMRISDVPLGALQRYEELKGGSMTYEDQSWGRTVGALGACVNPSPGFRFAAPWADIGPARWAFTRIRHVLRHL